MNARHALCTLRPLWWVLPLLCVLCLAMPRQSMAAERNTILSGKVVSPVTRNVPLPFNAIIDEIFVKPGDAVTNGQPLLTYHLQEEAERILQREVLMGAGTENEKGQVLDLERRLAETVAQRNKTRQLVASKLGSSQGLSRLEGDVSSLQQRIAILRASIKKTETAFQARLKELGGYFGTPITEGAMLPEQLTLTAPMAGHVLSVMPNLYPGTELNAHVAPVSVGILNPTLIQVQVYEAEINAIKEGDTATVQIPSLNDKEFAAKVDKIAWSSNNMNVDAPSFYTIELTVPNPKLELKPGFKAVVRFNKAGQ